jgi:hypothetical protein
LFDSPGTDSRSTKRIRPKITASRARPSPGSGQSMGLRRSVRNLIRYFFRALLRVAVRATLRRSLLAGPTPHPPIRLRRPLAVKRAHAR